MSEQQQGDDLAATDRAAAPNTTFLSKYLQGLDSGNKRAIARNAARGAQQVSPAAAADAGQAHRFVATRHSHSAERMHLMPWIFIKLYSC